MIMLPLSTIIHDGCKDSQAGMQAALQDLMQLLSCLADLARVLAS